MYNICFTLGDPGHDGHGNTSDYHMRSNYSANDIDLAYKAAVKLIGFDFIKTVCSEYDDCNLKEPYFSMLMNRNIIKESEFKYTYEGKEYLDTCLDENMFIEIFKRICKLVLPDLIMEHRTLPESTVQCLHGAAYGIVCHV